MNPRSLLASMWLALAASANPALTTIQDVLYKADGTRFNGTLTISWSSFQAADNSAIVTQTTTVKVLNGNLRVQLVPVTTANPPGAYLVTYNSDGRIQFRETWSVPASAVPLHVRDVRVASGNSTIGADTSGVVTEASVTGLLSDLAARPVKGPGFSVGRVMVMESAGLLESASGSGGDCVHVDGSSGPCGSNAPGFMDGETPGGVVDGSNSIFTLSAPPNPASSLAVYRNGLLQKPGLDYNATGQTVQFVAGAAPQPGDTLLASYRLNGEAETPIYASPQVVCSGAGAATNSATLGSVGSCVIPSGLLTPGDRLEARFDLEHQGSAAGFSFEVHWGGTVALHRDASTSDALATGRVDAALLTSGARLSAESWGSVLSLAGSVAIAPDAYAGGITVDFWANAAGGDTVALRNFSVVRVP